MVIYPVIIAIIFALLNWIAVYKKWKILEVVAKLATMIGLIWWFGANVGLGGPAVWFSLGLLFCLAGDIFLLFPQKMFIFGLLAFLVGQIAYIIGFNDQAPYFNLLGIVVIVLLGFYIAWLYPKLAGGIKEKGNNSLRIPVLIYSIVISLMVYSAMMTWTRPSWSMDAGLYASLGAISFYISDSILAWDRFVKPISDGRLANMVTYHLGQFGIILGAILHFTQM